MIKYFIFISLFSILLTSSSFAEDITVSSEEADEYASEKIFQQSKIEQKAKIVKELNKQIYNKKNDNLLKEYIRNSNAMKKIMEQPTKEVDINDKKAVSEYMQDDVGLEKEIIKVKLPEPKSKTARPRAADLLK